MSKPDSSLGIIAWWSEERGCNMFRIRGVGPRYDALYAWLNGPKCSARSVGDDWPWDFIVFDDPFHEQSFLILYQDDISFDEPPYSYRPLPANLKPLGWVPYDQRVEGRSYLEVCGHHHIWKKPSGRDFLDELSDVLSQAIADEIDREILDDLMRLSKVQ